MVIAILVRHLQPDDLFLAGGVLPVQRHPGPGLGQVGDVPGEVVHEHEVGEVAPLLPADGLGALVPAVGVVHVQTEAGAATRVAVESLAGSTRPAGEENGRGELERQESEAKQLSTASFRVAFEASWKEQSPADKDRVIGCSEHSVGFARKSWLKVFVSCWCDITHSRQGYTIYFLFGIVFFQVINCLLKRVNPFQAKSRQKHRKYLYKFTFEYESNIYSVL